MVINTIVYMLLIGVSGLLRLHIRQDKTLSWLMFVIIACLFCDYTLDSFEDQLAGFSILWNKSQIGDITIDFHPSLATNQIIIPLFFISTLAILNNNIFRYEERRCIYNSFIIFNFISLSLLICAENYVQLITMVCITDIIGYMILRDVDSSRRYVVYNFFADMCLFMILAMACGKIQSLDISRLLGYEQIGRHKDFVSIVTSIALFIKTGSFLFQSYLLDIGSARFQRMSTVNLLSAPLVGVLLFLKLHKLLFVSDLFMPIFEIMTILTFMAGIWGFITQRHIQRKVISLNMAFIGILLWLLKLNDFAWSENISLYYTAVYLFNQIYFMIYLYQNREADITKMVNANEINVIALKTLLWQIVLLNSWFIAFMYKTAISTASWTVFAGAILSVFVQVIILNHIYKAPQKRKLDYLNPNPKRVMSFVVGFILIFLGIYYERDVIGIMLLSLLAVLSLIASPLGNIFRKIYDNPLFSERDLSKTFFFYTLVSPLTYISRTFWLMVDILLSEKIITTGISKINKTAIYLFLKLNRQTLGANMLFIICGTLIIMWFFINGGINE